MQYFAEILIEKHNRCFCLSLSLMELVIMIMNIERSPALLLKCDILLLFLVFKIVMFEGFVQTE